jgi:hypothetical protein
MRLAFPMLMLALLCNQVQGLDDTNPPVNPMHKKAVDWIKKNCKSPPQGRLVPNMIDFVDERVEKSDNFYALFGRALMKSGKVTQIFGLDDEFFAFEYSSAQGKKLKTKDQSVTTCTAKRLSKTGLAIAEINGLTFDDAENLDGSQLITGTVTVKTLRPSTDRHALRLHFRTEENSESRFFYLTDPLPDKDRTMRFSFAPVNNANSAKKTTGPVVMFVTLCTVVSRNKIIRNSNSLGRIVDVAD